MQEIFVAGELGPLFCGGLRRETSLLGRVRLLVPGAAWNIDPRHGDCACELVRAAYRSQKQNIHTSKHFCLTHFEFSTPQSLIYQPYRLELVFDCPLLNCDSNKTANMADKILPIPYDLPCYN